MGGELVFIPPAFYYVLLSNNLFLVVLMTFMQQYRDSHCMLRFRCPCHEKQILQIMGGGFKVLFPVFFVVIGFCDNSFF